MPTSSDLRLNGLRPGAAFPVHLVALGCLLLLGGAAHAQGSASGSAAAASPSTEGASTTAATQTLIEQARHWERNRRPDMARQLWGKLLAVDPRHPDALQGMAVLNIDESRFEEAQSYVDRLRKVRPDHPALERLSRQVRTRTTSQALLATARQQAQAGQADAASRSYREALGAKPANDELALEYYQTLGGTNEGWDEARVGLERLAQAQPSQGQVQLAYARHLSYRMPTRNEAIRRLSALAARTDVPNGVRQDARTAWLQALLWSGSAADPAQLRQYISSVGPDPRLSALLQAREKTPAGSASGSASAVPAAPSARDLAMKAAYAALDAGELDAAASQFETLLRQRPREVDALGGLGLTRLRQERFDEAVELLGRATAQPAGSRWKTMERTARHWQALGEANAARQAGDTDRALRLARAAVESDPKEPEAQILLGDLLAAQGRLPQAESAYRAALQATPRPVRALAGLISVLGASGRVDQAQAMIRELDDSQLARLGGAGTLRANQLRLQAEQAQQRGDSVGAQALLEQAVALAPQSAWARLALGQLLVRQNRLDEASAQLDAMALPAAGTERLDALQARALLQAELKDHAGALASLEQIPRAQRSAAMAQLHRRMAVQAQAAEAVALYRAGQPSAAAALLAEAEGAAGQDPDLISAVAGAYLDLGHEARAAQLIRATLAAQPQAGPALLLRHAALLLQTRQDAELSRVLGQLISMARLQQLGPAQRRDLDELRLGYSVRQADLLREAGDLASAWEAIAPLMQERPGEPRLQMALARMHLGAGEPDAAIALYESVLRERPEEVDAWLGLAAAADARKDRDTAAQALEQARRLAPDRPEVLAQQARHYRARGQFAKASEYLRLAMAAQQPAAVAQWGQPRMAANPFAQRRATPLAAAVSPPSPSALPPLPPISDSTVLSGDLDRLPPPAAGLPAPGSAAESPVARTLRWREATAATATATATATASAATPAAAAASAPASVRSASRSGRTAAAPSPAPSSAPSPRTEPATTALPVAVAAAAALPPLPAPAAGRAAASRAAGASVLAALPGQPPQRRSRTLADELTEIQAERGPGSRIEGGGALRSRDGEGGFGRLDTFQAPAEGRIAIDELGQVVVRATPVFLSAGEVGAETGTRRRHGTLALDPTGVTTPGDQSDAGIALAVGLETRSISADIGTVPVGFAVGGAVGGVRWEDAIGSGGLRLMIEGSRRALNDSLLAFAGSTDARTGRVWGGVRATGLRSQLSWEQDDVGLYGYGGAQALTGRGVASNNRLEAGGGGYWRARSTPDDRLELGLNLGYQHYRRNLSGYTLGHGGYFSPQHLLALTVPVNWTGRSGRLSWGVQGAAGLQTYREESAPYFPTEAGLQSWLESLVAAGQTPTARYAARSDSGMTLNLGGALEYQITRQLDVGARIGFEHAPQYSQGMGSVYLRFSLEPRGTATGGLRMPAGPALQ